MIPERDYGQLKDLSLKFVSNRNPKIFIAIALLVDKLLFYTIHEARKAKPYLRKVSMDDLYQDAILGLYAALLKTKQDEPGSKIIYNIVGYVNNAITKQNKRTNQVAFPFSIGDIAFQVHLYASDMPQSRVYISRIEDKLSSNDPVYKNLELESVREKFRLLIEEDVISFEEFRMITMYVVNDMTYKTIAAEFDSSIATVSRRIKNALNRLRYEFRVRGWGKTL